MKQKFNKWTIEEEEILINEFHNTKNKDLAILLKKSYEQIITKGHSLRLYKDKNHIIKNNTKKQSENGYWKQENHTFVYCKYCNAKLEIRSVLRPRKFCNKNCQNKYYWSQKEYREKMILNTTNLFYNENSNFGKSKSYKQGKYNFLKSGNVFLRSGWELEYANYLEHNDEVIEFFVEKIRIKYNDNNIYVPDFKVIYKNKQIEIHEVKGEITENTIQKWIAGIKYCKENNMTYRLFSKKHWREKLTEFYLKDFIDIKENLF